MAPNGQLPKSSLAPIVGGELRADAARAWNDGPGKAGCRPTGSKSSYRTYAEQQYFWDLYQSGAGNLAAFPGTSNHGWGTAIDVAAPWMATWIAQHGARYGWKKTEAFGEWWHFNYVGGYKPRPSPLRFLKGAARTASSTLLARRRQREAEGQDGKGPKWRALNRAVTRARTKVAGLYRQSDGRAARVLKRVLRDRDGRL